jgi:hypothetical protein
MYLGIGIVGTFASDAPLASPSVALTPAVLYDAMVACDRAQARAMQALYALRHTGDADPPLPAVARQRHRRAVAEAQHTMGVLALLVHHRKAICALGAGEGVHS